MIKISVIIPSWNGKNLLEECLASAEDQSFKDFDITVVDNSSTDGTVEFLSKFFPRVRVIKMAQNSGFAKAINSAVKASQAEYIATLNNDTVLDKNWLKSLIETAEKHPEVASVSSKLLNYYHKDIIDGVGISINEVGQARSIGYQEKDKGQYDNLKYIFGATGGAALFRRDIFIKVGLFDENYFMYSEEVDWAFRAQFLGYKSIFCPKAIVYHKHKATSSKMPQKLEYWQFKNMSQTIIKDMPTKIILKNFRWLKIILVHINTIIYQIRHGYFWPPVMTEVWLLYHLPDLMKRRIKIQKSRRVQLEEIEQYIKPKKITFFKMLKNGF